jgi:large subunit ribosomal protein L22
MEVKAITRFSGISAQKTRLVVDEVRGKGAEDALVVLQFMPQSAAKVVAKTIRSALANATENFGLESSDMFVARIFADEGPRRRWRRYGARGRFKPMIRPSSHITVVLEERTANE